MSSLLFLYEQKTPTSVMMQRTFMRIDSSILSKVCFKEVKKVISNDINHAEVVILIRSTDSLSVRIAREAKKAGRYVIAFYDDDLMNRPADRPIISWRRTNVLRVLNTSDIVLSSSVRICEKYKLMTIGKKGVKTDTAVYPDEFRTASKSECDTVRIVYAANSDHAALFEKYINPALPLLGKQESQISFTFIGVHPAIPDEQIPCNVRTKYVTGMPFSEYRRYMSSHDFDLGLAPLSDDEFSKCKYINKFLEYAIFQIPGIFTKSEPYTHVVKNGENGYLVKNTEWVHRLAEIISDRDGYIRCGKNAMKTVKSEFDADFIIHRLFREVPELLVYNAPEQKCYPFFWGRIEYAVQNLYEKLYLLAIYMRELGVIGLIDKICSHIKEKRTFERKISQRK